MGVREADSSAGPVFSIAATSYHSADGGSRAPLLSSAVPVAVVVPSAAALSAFSRSAASSSHLAERSRSHRSPGPRPAPTQSAVMAPSIGSSQVHSCLRSPDPSPIWDLTRLPVVPSPDPGLVTRLGAVLVLGTSLPPTLGRGLGLISCLGPHMSTGSVYHSLQFADPVFHPL